MKKNILALICTTSGTSNEFVDEYKILLAKKRQIKSKVITFKKPTELDSKIKNLDINKFTQALVYGGDGTAIYAINLLKEYNIPLMILPGGSANVLANYFKMPEDPIDGVKSLVKNIFVTNIVDIATINNQPFILDMHAGYWTDTIVNTPRRLKKKFGALAYGIYAIRNLKNAKKHTFRFEIDGKKQLKISGYTFLIANQGEHKISNQPLFPTYQVPGYVQLAVFKTLNPLHLFAWVLYKNITLGKNLNSAIRIYKAKSITIKKSPEEMLADDTEIALKTPIKIEASKKGVRILMPPTSSELNYLKKLLKLLQLKYVLFSQRIRVFLGVGPSEKISHVAPSLYLGGKLTKRNIKSIEKWGVTGIVSLRMSAPPITPKNIETKWLPTKDWSPPKLEDFFSGTNFIKEKIENDGSVYIHCQLGEGRGPSMAAAYLISQGLTVDEALKQLSKYRPVVRPSASQIKQLSLWQERYNSFK